jgi:tRNA(fMet)-specific endonuclease VapC
MSVTYLLDTNTVSYIARGKPAAPRARLQALGKEELVCISSITDAEIRYELAKRPEAHSLRRAMEDLMLKFCILPWGSREAAAYGELRAKLEAKGSTLAELDMMIAAHAIAIGAVLVTNDKPLSRIKDLLGTVNWAIG